MSLNTIVSWVNDYILKLANKPITYVQGQNSYNTRNFNRVNIFALMNAILEKDYSIFNDSGTGNFTIVEIPEYTAFLKGYHKELVLELKGYAGNSGTIDTSGSQTVMTNYQWVDFGPIVGTEHNISGTNDIGNDRYILDIQDKQQTEDHLYIYINYNPITDKQFEITTVQAVTANLGDPNTWSHEIIYVDGVSFKKVQMDRLNNLTWLNNINNLMDEVEDKDLTNNPSIPIYTE